MKASAYFINTWLPLTFDKLTIASLDLGWGNFFTCELYFRKALTLLTKNKTTVVIAHRLSTILNSDQIYVIDSGKVIGNGTHDHLLKHSSVYKNFYDKQITKN